AGKTASPYTFRGFVLRQFDRVIGVNRELEQLFYKFGVAKNRIRMIYPHAVTLPPPEAALPDRLARFFQAHTPNILTVSGLEPEYALPVQIDALGPVRRRFPNAGLAIVGAGSLEEEMRKQIQSKPYAEHILLCGDVPHSSTLRAMAESDLFLR